VKRVVYLAAAALVALMILVPSAIAQEMTMKENIMMEKTVEPLPPSGGPAVGAPARRCSARGLGHPGVRRPAAQVTSTSFPGPGVARRQKTGMG
jgi:hypothetical protein